MALEELDPSEFPTDYKDFEEVGSGGFGIVHVCSHATLGRRVALKLFQFTGSAENIQQAKNEFNDEAKILQRMNHPHIVTFYGVTSLFGREGLVMEFLEGGNLHDLIRSNEDLPWTERLRLLRELISAINYLHNHDKNKAFIHGDIKPPNTLLTKLRVLKLADFGAVNITVPTNAPSPSIKITPKTQHTWQYTAPEFFDPHANKSPAIDIYSFSIVVYELLTRTRPYEDARRDRFCHKKSLKNEIYNGTRPNQSELDKVKEQLKQHQDVDIFLKLQSLMKECWEHDPTKRPKATEILKALTKQMDEVLKALTKQMDELSATNAPDMEISSQQDDNASVNTTPIPVMELKTIVPQKLLATNDTGVEPIKHMDEIPNIKVPDVEPTTQQVEECLVTSVPETECMIVGGWKSKHIVEIYEIKDKDFKPRKPTVYERYGSTSVKIDNHVFTGGGDASNTAEFLDLNKIDGDWKEISSMNKRRFHAASTVWNDQMCVSGGLGGEVLSSVELYNPVVNTWTNIASMQTKRWEHALVFYNGRLFTFGGSDGDVFGSLSRLNSMESFDPREGKWKFLQPMNEGRSGLSGVVYYDEIYAVGGSNLKSVECYNFRTNTWTKVRNMNKKRAGSCACVVNGKIYVIGGAHDDALNTTEAYDATTNEWKIEETNMETPRIYASVVAL
uniref:receptor-interacting serine/threonine-protein kinase 1-like isoform X2 n=1 Tax=Ciona intestinalis TaxID=7719 RepID=UPI000EF4E263|nr:receptor-interacting serine/threonine-protein kinase 1-like isoform X2 [Ciona intestinalis]|eukprot:XP_026695246.1 receptor-interacting serine/threonine-protein kinase 1-like isoform X2 [Ciona intestinalis]